MSTRSRLVLLVGGDSETARNCARAAAPLPVVRAKHLDTATNRLRSMKPLVMVVASDVSHDDLVVLERVASEESAELVRFDRADAPEALQRAARR